MIEIGPVIKGQPGQARGPVRKAIFGVMEVGDMREFRCDEREMCRVRQGAHYIGRKFGWVFTTRYSQGVLTVWRTA